MIINLTLLCKRNYIYFVYVDFISDCTYNYAVDISYDNLLCSFMLCKLRMYFTLCNTMALFTQSKTCADSILNYANDFYIMESIYNFVKHMILDYYHIPLHKRLSMDKTLMKLLKNMLIILTIHTNIMNIN